MSFRSTGVTVSPWGCRKWSCLHSCLSRFSPSRLWAAPLHWFLGDPVAKACQNQCGDPDDLWISFSIIFPPWRLIDINSQITLSSYPVRSKKSHSLHFILSPFPSVQTGSVSAYIIPETRCQVLSSSSEHTFWAFSMCISWELSKSSSSHFFLINSFFFNSFLSSGILLYVVRRNLVGPSTLC